jgi:hypothetical protein
VARFGDTDLPMSVTECPTHGDGVGNPEPAAGQRVVDRLEKFGGHFGSFTSSWNTFRTLATFGAATAWQ